MVKDQNSLRAVYICCLHFLSSHPLTDFRQVLIPATLLAELLSRSPETSRFTKCSPAILSHLTWSTATDSQSHPPFCTCGFQTPLTLGSSLASVLLHPLCWSLLLYWPFSIGDPRSLAFIPPWSFGLVSWNSIQTDDLQVAVSRPYAFPTLRTHISTFHFTSPLAFFQPCLPICSSCCLPHSVNDHYFSCWGQIPWEIMLDLYHFTSTFKIYPATSLSSHFSPPLLPHPSSSYHQMDIARPPWVLPCFSLHLPLHPHPHHTIYS